MRLSRFLRTKRAYCSGDGVKEGQREAWYAPSHETDMRLNVVQHGGYVGVEVNQRQADGGGQLVAVVVGDVFNPDGDLAPAACEPIAAGRT